MRRAALALVLLAWGLGPARAEPHAQERPLPAPGAIARPGSIPFEVIQRYMNPQHAAPGAIPDRNPPVPAAPAARLPAPPLRPPIAPRPVIAPRAPRIAPPAVPSAPVAGQRYFPAHPTLQDRLRRERGAPAFAMPDFIRRGNARASQGLTRPSPVFQKVPARPHVPPGEAVGAPDMPRPPAPPFVAPPSAVPGPPQSIRPACAGGRCAALTNRR